MYANGKIPVRKSINMSQLYITARHRFIRNDQVGLWQINSFPAEFHESVFLEFSAKPSLGCQTGNPLAENSRTTDIQLGLLQTVDS